MRTGLYAMTLSQGSTVVLRLGWAKRDHKDPDEYRVFWCTMYREDYTKLGPVWEGGEAELPSSMSFGPPLEAEAFRFHIVPLAKLKPEAWKKTCPRPDWITDADMKEAEYT